MSDYQIGAGEEQLEVISKAEQPKGEEEDVVENAIGRFSGRLLDRGDSIIYAIVGACFFIGGFIALGYSFWDFGNTVFTQSLTPIIFAGAIIQLVSDLLLVLIIMEVLGTVTHYLKAHATSLRPFLFIGIVSATRGILSIGARLSVGGAAAASSKSTGISPEFISDMIELGVNGAVILALGITLKLLGKFVED